MDMDIDTDMDMDKDEDMGLCYKTSEYKIFNYKMSII
jgi:hypothetical protein